MLPTITALMIIIDLKLCGVKGRSPGDWVPNLPLAPACGSEDGEGASATQQPW